jgi:large subunit ribosomal protein L31
MKTDIHPKYQLTTVVCSCGNTFTTHSTRGGEVHIELCNECHPFFTGKQKLVDSGAASSASSAGTASGPRKRRPRRPDPPMALSAERRAALLATKLAALVRTVAGEGSFVPGVFGAGAAGVVGDVAWVLLDDRPARGLGPALAWAEREAITPSMCWPSRIPVCGPAGRTSPGAHRGSVRSVLGWRPGRGPPPVAPHDLDLWRAHRAGGATSVLEPAC